MNADKYRKSVERENARVTHEWDKFMEQHGQSWGKLSEEAKAAAIELAGRQGDRDKWMRNEYGQPALVGPSA